MTIENDKQTQNQILKVMLTRGTRYQIFEAAKEIGMIPKNALETPENLECIVKLLIIVNGEEPQISDGEDLRIITARKEIIDAFAPHWELNDRGHQREHFEEVFQCAKHINWELGLGYTEIDMLFAGYFHDLFAWSRINHHELSFRYFASADHSVITKYFDLPSGECIGSGRFNVAYACAEHRASFKGRFTTKFSELINSADRGFPGNVQLLLDRCVMHRTDVNPDMSADEVMVSSIKHLKEKSGSQGYARYPDLYMRVFGDKLKEQKEEIDRL